MEIQVGLWWWKWKPLKLSKSPHAGDWWLDDFGHDDDIGDDSADDDGDNNDMMMPVTAIMTVMIVIMILFITYITIYLIIHWMHIGSHEEAVFG